MKKSRDNFEVLCIFAMVETERYRKLHDELQKKKNDDIEMIKKSYVPGTDLYGKALDRVKQEYEKAVAELQADYVEGVSKQIEEVRSEELARVQTVSEAKLAKLKAIADIPMTADELLAVAERYEADDDYWCSRLLVNIAESNGIEGFEKYVESSYSVKSDLLSQLSDQVDEMVRDYDGKEQRDAEKRQRTNHVLLTKPVLDRCRAFWSGEYNFTSDEDAVAKAYSTVQLKRTDVEKGLAIANVLKNAKGEKRNLLLCRLAEDTHISEFALRLSGYGTELEAFRAGKAREYRKAKEVVENLGNITDKTNRETLIATNSDNPFLDGLIRSEAKRNTIFRELVGQAYSDADNATVES